MLGYFIETTVEFISERLPAVLLATLAAAAVRWLLIRRGALQRRSNLHEGAVIVFACYAAVVLSLTFLPLPFWGFLFHPSPSHYDFHSTLLAMLRGEYIPGRWSRTMLIANVLMFVPLGFLLPILWRQAWWRPLLTALAATLCIELVQPFFDRSFDVDDILLNFAGAVLGLLLSVLPRALCPGLMAKIRE